MITYRNLGKVGRLGNALFELAATIGIGLDHGEDVRFPADWLHRPFFSVPDEMFGPIPDDAKEATEFADHLDSRARSYLQDVNLFLPYLDLIRSYLQPSPRAIEVLSNYKLPGHGVPRFGVHVRRGDNVYDPGVPNKGDYHYCPTLDYYRRAINLLYTKAPYVYGMSTCVFGDDIPWCKENLGGADFYGDGRAYWKEHETMFGTEAPVDWLDLFLLSQMDYLVITGSTFGIWGAFLANVPPEQVVRPDKVFGPIVAAYTNSELMFDPKWRVVTC